MLKLKLPLAALLTFPLGLIGCGTSLGGGQASLPQPPPLQVPASCLTAAPDLPPPLIRETYPATKEALFRVLAEDAKGDAIGARDAYGALAIDKNACAAGLKAQGAK